FVDIDLTAPTRLAAESATGTNVRILGRMVTIDNPILSQLANDGLNRKTAAVVLDIVHRCRSLNVVSHFVLVIIVFVLIGTAFAVYYAGQITTSGTPLFELASRIGTIATAAEDQYARLIVDKTSLEKKAASLKRDIEEFRDKYADKLDFSSDSAVKAK